MCSRRLLVAAVLLTTIAACSNGGDDPAGRRITAEDIRRLAQEVGEETPDSCPVVDTEAVREAVRAFDPGDVVPREDGEPAGPAVVHDDIIICDWDRTTSNWYFRVQVTGDPAVVEKVRPAIEGEPDTDGSEILFENGRASERTYGVIEGPSVTVSFLLERDFLDPQPSVEEMRRLGDFLLAKVREALTG